MSQSSSAVSFLYKNAFGRAILKIILKTHADKVAVAFLRSRLSRPFVARYARKNGIALSDTQLKSFRSYNDFFVRRSDALSVDLEREHLISPCDSLLSVFKIDADSRFDIKGSSYSLCDLFADAELAKIFCGGDCLIFRLCPTDYHHYCYIDNAYQCENRFIEGVLHSVQPIACEKYPVYTLNRRSSTLLLTENFGKVVQTEVGALVVGGIVNPNENVNVKKGEEKGYFELCGSTIVLFFEKNKIRLLPEIAEKTADGKEHRVSYGMQIGYKNGG